MPLTAAMSSGTRRSGAGTRRPPPRPPPPSPTEHPPPCILRPPLLGWGVRQPAPYMGATTIIEKARLTAAKRRNHL